MKHRADIFRDSLIPADGGYRSLADIFSRDRSPARISGTPTEKIAFYRLIFGISQAAVRVRDEEEKKSLGLDGFSEACLGYLEKHSDEFFLYGDKPFLQFPQIDSLKGITVRSDYMRDIPDVAHRNDPIARTGRIAEGVHTPEEDLSMLLQLDGYALGGKRISRTAPLTPGYDKSISGKSGPFLGSGYGYLHTMILGRTVLETAYLSLLTDESILRIRRDIRLGARPPWEDMPKGEDDERAREIKDSIWAWYTPLSRFMHLRDGGIEITEGIQYPGSPRLGHIDPFLTVTGDADNPEKLSVLYADPARQPWRSLPAMLQAAYKADGTSTCPIIRENLRFASEIGSFSICSIGIRVRKSAGSEQMLKGTDDTVLSEFHIGQGQAGELGYAAMCSLVKEAEELAEALRKAMVMYRLKGCRDDPASAKKAAAAAAADFWSRADSISERIVGIAGEPSDEQIVRIREELGLMLLASYSEHGPLLRERGYLAWLYFSPGKGVDSMDYTRKARPECFRFVSGAFRGIAESSSARGSVRMAETSGQDWAAAPFLASCGMPDDGKWEIYLLIAEAILRDGRTRDGNLGFGEAMNELLGPPEDMDYPMRMKGIMTVSSVDDAIMSLRPLMSLIASRGTRISYALLLSDLVDMDEGRIDEVLRKWSWEYCWPRWKRKKNIKEETNGNVPD